MATPSARARSPLQRLPLGGKYRFFTSFGRTGLLAALMAVDVKRREVVLPAFTCGTTVTSAVLQAGGTPVFVDVDPATFNLDIGELEGKLADRTAAVISHHYFGFACSNLDAVNRLCERCGVSHIEDCAHSLGAEWNGTTVGSWGRIAVFSFSKAMPNPGGGCVATGDEHVGDQIEERFGRCTCLDAAVKNYHAFTYLSRLRADMQEKADLVHGLLTCLKTPLLCLGKRMKYDLRRVRGSFYQEGFDEATALNPAALNISMTSFQHRYIERSLRNMGCLIAAKKALFEAILSLIPSPVDLCDVSPAYTTFVVKVANKATVLKHAQRAGIRLRETWPAFQDYFPEQMTENIRFMGNHYLLITLHQYLEKHKRDRLLRFLRRAADEGLL